MLEAHYRELGDPYRIVSGTSAGALNAAGFLALGPDGLVDLWQRITERDVFRRPWLRGLSLLRRGALFDHRPLRDLLEENVSPRDIQATNAELYVHAYEIARRAQVTFDQDSTRLLDGIWASASIPFAFPSVPIGPLELVDGGIVANVPIRLLVERGCTAITVVVPDAKRPPVRLHYGEKPPKRVTNRLGIFAKGGELLDAALDKQFEAELRGSRLISAIARTGSASTWQGAELDPMRHAHVAIEVLRPTTDPGGTLDFEPAHLARLIRLGEADAETHLQPPG